MTNHTTAQAAVKRDPVGGGAIHEYLAFRLGAEEYAADILKVQEIRGYDKPTAIAMLQCNVSNVPYRSLPRRDR